MKKELLATIWAVKHFRSYIYGKRYSTYTGHFPFIYQVWLIQQINMFRLALEECDFSVQYMKDKANVTADAKTLYDLKKQELRRVKQ